jgi:pimeloyl-ACP methyl ester carboxylesterase
MHLAGLGYDTFVVELRGHTPEARTSIFDGPCATRTFDAHLRLDLPAAVSAVRAASGADTLHYVGHSMGGLLGYAAASSGRAEFMRTCTVIGSSLDYATSDSDFHLMVKLLPLSWMVPGLPFGSMGTASAPFALTVPSAIDRFNVWPSNIDADRYRRLLAIGFVNEPISLLLSLVSSITGGGLVGDDGTRYGDAAALARIDVPLLALAGDRDRQCPFAAAHATFDLVGSRDKTLAKLGTEHGTHDHYGHVDLVSGLRAPEETWPSIDAFLDARG